MRSSSLGILLSTSPSAMTPTARADAVLERLTQYTETDDFRGQRHEIPAKMVTGNPQVESFSRCEACHRRAERGVFNEHEVRIPGSGRFND